MQFKINNVETAEGRSERREGNNPGGRTGKRGGRVRVLKIAVVRMDRIESGDGKHC